jgi:signal transduction histidine kinase
MPGLDGFQTTALIRQRDRTRHTPIIFVTAIFTDDVSAKRAYALGALDYIKKPFDEEVLRAKVAALTSHYRQADLIRRQADALREKDSEAKREHQAREAAETANRTKDEFLALVSHELRAPLNAIIGWASLLRDEPGLSGRAAKGIEAIARSADTQSKLVDDLIDVSQMIAGTLTIEASPVDLGSVTRSAIASMRSIAVERRIRIDVDVAPGPYWMHGDVRRLEQLVCSLLSNAIKFSADGAPVTVELFRSGAGLQLRVKDKGIGIPDDVLPHVFDPFRRSDNSWTRRHNGLGIGLTMARHIAELHGGIVEAFSAGDGLGAVFVLTLPPSDEPAPTTQANAPRPSPTGALAAVQPGVAAKPLTGLRVLVVDDDSDLRDLIGMILIDAGAFVSTAGSAREALSLFERDSFDVLLSDLGMPEQDGLSLMRSIRALDAARGGSLVAVAISGYGSATDRKLSADAGFDAHFTKPCESRKLIESLLRLTARLRPEG